MWKQLISIEERRVSALVVGFLATLIYCMVMYAVRKELDRSWVDVLQALIAGIVGIGGINALKEYWEAGKSVGGKGGSADGNNRNEPAV